MTDTETDVLPVEGSTTVESTDDAVLIMLDIDSDTEVSTVD